MAYRFTRERESPGGYHVFHQGLNGIWIFRDDEDRRTFEWMINRHLSEVPSKDSRGRPYVSLREVVRLNARNLMSSHFHLILWQKVPGGIDRLMRRVLAGYVRYYHRKYETSGPLFAGEYRARRLNGPKTFMWRVGYVHDNHKRLGVDYRFSTHGLYLRPDDAPSWLDVSSTLKVFGGPDGYVQYMKKRAERNSLDEELRLDLPW
ncbi:MAG: hypothetical protein JHD02_05415 [Thermoleophilaceae bacterium]|nr:hypothetical protein [Thermoleophilaceae bacterium]